MGKVIREILVYIKVFSFNCCLFFSGFDNKRKCVINIFSCLMKFGRGCVDLVYVGKVIQEGFFVGFYYGFFFLQLIKSFKNLNGVGV